MQYLESLPQEEQQHLWGMLDDHNERPHDKDAKAVLDIIDMLDRNSMNDYGAYLERLQVRYRALPVWCVTHYLTHSELIPLTRPSMILCRLLSMTLVTFGNHLKSF